MILSDQEIRRRMREQRLIVGADDGQINPASVRHAARMAMRELAALNA